MDGCMFFKQSLGDGAFWAVSFVSPIPYFNANINKMYKKYVCNISVPLELYSLDPGAPCAPNEPRLKRR